MYRRELYILYCVLKEEEMNIKQSSFVEENWFWENAKFNTNVIRIKKFGKGTKKLLEYL